MPTVALQVSKDPVLTLPADLAEQAGLVEGQVQVILGEHSLTLVPATATPDYTSVWLALSSQLQEQVAEFVTGVDQRDEEYWTTVAPLYEEADRTIGSV